MEIEHQAGARTREVRRVFIAPSEIPGLLIGALRGEPVRLRRILGARGAGRYGIALAAAALGIACPPRLWPTALLLHALASFVGWRASGSPRGLGPRPHQRLLLWVIAPTLAGAAVLRPLVPALGVLVAGLALGHGLLARHLRAARPFGPLATDSGEVPSGSPSA